MNINEWSFRLTRTHKNNRHGRIHVLFVFCSFRSISTMVEKKKLNIQHNRHRSFSSMTCRILLSKSTVHIWFDHINFIVAHSIFVLINVDIRLNTKDSRDSSTRKQNKPMLLDWSNTMTGHAYDYTILLLSFNKKTTMSRSSATIMKLGRRNVRIAS
jgi:hypothetical protein